MPRVNLLSKPYVGKNLIANGQQAINLYAESNAGDPTAPTPITYYQFPGNSLFASPLEPFKCRCIYRTSIGTAYVVVGPFVYYCTIAGLILIGTIPDRASQVYMADNGLAVVLVDGVEGWAIDIVANTFGQIIDASFYGADFVVFLDTFFIFNRPDTNQFYISLSMVDYSMLTGGTAFDALDIAAKAGSADPIVSIYTTHKELGLVGQLTTEIWIGTGAPDFYFQQVQGAYIDHGSIAPYSQASQDVITFWLMQDKQGKNIVVQAIGYEIKEISTPYLVSEFNKYTTTADAIGMCFQIEDHAFYLITFPTANISWLYDLTTGYWSQLGKWNSATNSFDRYRANACGFAFGYNLIGDYETGKIYKLNPELATEGETDDDLEELAIPMKFRRTFLHMVGGNFERVIYDNCIADIQPGTSTKPVASEDDNNEPKIFLSYSDDRGKTFNTPRAQSLGREGQYNTTPKWNKLGMARDRIFALEWNGPVITALNGAFVNARQART